MDVEPVRHSIWSGPLRLCVWEWNPGGMRTALCVHGHLEFALCWAPIVAQLVEAGYRVLAPDLRGHGDSDWVSPAASYHLWDFALDTSAVLEQLAPGTLALIGHSLGGIVTTVLAAAMPRRARRLVLLEGVGGGDREEPAVRFNAWIDEMRVTRGRLPAVYPSVEAAAARIRNVDRRCGEEMALWLASHGTRAVPGGRSFKHDPRLQTRGPLGTPLDVLRPYFHAVRCETLLLEGGESKTTKCTPDLADRYRCFRAARVEKIDGAGHMLIRHKPREVAQRLLAFLAADRDGGEVNGVSTAQRTQG